MRDDHAATDATIPGYREAASYRFVKIVKSVVIGAGCDESSLFRLVLCYP